MASPRAARELEVFLSVRKPRTKLAWEEFLGLCENRSVVKRIRSTMASEARVRTVSALALLLALTAGIAIVFSAGPGTSAAPLSDSEASASESLSAVQAARFDENLNRESSDVVDSLRAIRTQLAVNKADLDDAEQGHASAEAQHAQEPLGKQYRLSPEWLDRNLRLDDVLSSPEANTIAEDREELDGRLKREARREESLSTRALNKLALHFLRRADEMSENQMLSTLSAWRHSPTTLLASIDEASKALAEGTTEPHDSLSKVDPQLSGLIQREMKLSANDEQLCGKKNRILRKFDRILQRLSMSERELAEHLEQATKDWKALAKMWLDTEQEYRLRSQELADASSGAKMAEDEFVRWRLARKTAQQAVDDHKANDASVLEALKDEDSVLGRIAKYAKYIVRFSSSSPGEVKRLLRKIKRKDVKLDKIVAEEEKIRPDLLKEQTDDVKFLDDDISSGRVTQRGEAEQVMRTARGMQDGVATASERVAREEIEAKKLVLASKKKVREWQRQLVRLSALSCTDTGL